MRALALASLLLVACAEEPPMGVSSGTGGAVCSFTASGTMSNLKTTSLSTDPINDSIFGVTQNGAPTFTWLRNFAEDAGCLGDTRLDIGLPQAPSMGATTMCPDASLRWAEGDCGGTRAWTCALGSVTVDAVNGSSVDLSFHGMSMTPDAALDTNQATGMVTLDGTCTGVVTH
jgi:hypothetical protein